MKRIGAYGSLKYGFHNFERMGEQRLCGETTIKGTMLMFSNYPYLFNCLGSEYENEHQVEIYEVDDATYERIADMELGSGYHTEHINVDGNPVVLFIANPKPKDTLLTLLGYRIMEYSLEAVREHYDKNYMKNTA
jgi:gamma-glutamylcyclotransferase (GGCT)/AIG2-like uncharacterized protein YtfP